jgi:hypothetical protein
VDKQAVSGRVTNTGQTLVFRVEEGQLAINITGGPLAYKYQFEVRRWRSFIVPVIILLCKTINFDVFLSEIKVSLQYHLILSANCELAYHF